MQVPNYYLAQKLSEQRLRDGLRNAEKQRVLRNAGIDQRGWFALQGCRLLSGLGCLLVALGRRLKRIARLPVGSAASLPRASGA